MNSSRMNPYGVGYTGATVTLRYGRCVCCGLAFGYEAPKTQGGRIYCDTCVGHRPADPVAETPEERTIRLEQDNVRIIEFTEQMKTKLNEMQKDLNDKGAQVRSALRTRAEAEAKVRRVERVHTERLDGKCECGGQWPCETIRALDGRNVDDL